MSYSKDQETIVLKVLSYKPHQFYEILAVEKTSGDSEIKKSYRKLAIKLHPDKNPHPRAAEAFKFLNKAWGVLSDPSKKRIFDQTGSDPDLRFSGQQDPSAGFASGSAFSRQSGFNQFGGGGGSPFEDDIFNLFFGGQQRTGPAFTFGGNGFSFQSFGGQDPFTRHRQHQQQRQQQQREERPPQDASILDILKQFLPILLIILVPVISNLFSESSSVPDYSFTRNGKFNLERMTPRHKIPFYVSKSHLVKKQLSPKQLRNFDYKVENVYVQDKKSKCSREQMVQSDMMEDAIGWFSTDYNKLRQAENMPMPNCDALRSLNLM
jgi:DnaJ-class molecular chaperone with C-terminal Zn finger domain